MSDLENKKRIAHLEAVNAMAIETIRQIEISLIVSIAGHSDETLDNIKDSIKWFNKYGCTDNN